MVCKGGLEAEGVRGGVEGEGASVDTGGRRCRLGLPQTGTPLLDTARPLNETLK